MIMRGVDTRQIDFTQYSMGELCKIPIFHGYVYESKELL